MGDMTVDVVWQSMLDAAFDNGIDSERLRPVAGAIVQRLRESGMDDDQIEKIFFDQGN